MDDLALLDLLECPVCFEKLDVTAKVLPCQHTFCKPCLQRIFKTRKELRCPECRTLVFCSIEELPANLLLVRLLDGVRSGQSMVRVGSFRRPGVLTSQDSRRKSRTEPRSSQPSPYRLIPNVQNHMDGVPRAKALCNYRGQNPNDLRFNKGDIILLRRQLDENWYQGEINGISGIFPTSSVEVIKQLPQPPPLCRALYNFDLKDKDKNENQNCLTFQKDDVITVIRRVDENWAEGKLGDKVGIFPILFVEPNLTARHLLEKGKSHRSSHIKSMSLTSSSPRSKVADSTAFNQALESRRKNPRQFSIMTALNTLNRMVHSSSGQQMVKIGSPVLISSSNPSVSTQNLEKKELSSNSPVQVSTYYNTPGSRSAAIVNLPYSQQHIPTNMFVAVHSYSAKGPDELDLQKGEGIRVIGKYHEGWLKGVSLVTGRVGIFPKDYVVPIFRKSSGYSNSRTPLYTTWTLSTSSVSPGLKSDNDSRQGHHFKSVLVPTAVVNPVRNSSGSAAFGQTSLQKVRSSMRKNGSLQRSSLSGSPNSIVGSLQRTSTVAVPIHSFSAYQSKSVPPPPPTTPVIEIGSRPSSTSESTILFGNRSSDSRIHSATSSIILETKESPLKSELCIKPPASAPPSILVKPENSKNGSEKQVKTVRFQNYSPPPPKHHSFHSTSGKPDSMTISKGSQAETGPLCQEMTTLFVHRSGSHSGQQTDHRRTPKYSKPMPPIIAASDIAIIPSK
ncbi:E3 ubiquitin-protein ligase SH3RF2 isoform X1 [Sarcophilus harrisii]|uniref:E3 ubiquitin-protein ligase SH3RF2 n=1 Tax=Sarcophilus harrisii TaxID=9305 RepID=G3VGM7_SARHA|nr:E3 ubiquitin-protein ligase SH3RF2 isoform X1 [Sarcophilus harrisii]XP_031809337.1 E3 ubiquitin-protein ligase SH3RF2 isoform X1 [Sarcophilus harrisii]